MPTEDSTQEVPTHDEQNQAEGHQDESQDESQNEQVAGDAADDKPEMTREDLLAALAKSRRQAAKYRVERNELRPLADKARELEEAGKSELQKAQERIAALEAEKQAGELEAERLQIAAKHGLPAELVTGADAEAMESMASALAAYVGEKLEEKSKPRLPVVKAVGRESGGIDPDARARQLVNARILIDGLLTPDRKSTKPAKISDNIRRAENQWTIALVDAQALCSYQKKILTSGRRYPCRRGKQNYAS